MQENKSKHGVCVSVILKINKIYAQWTMCLWISVRISVWISVCDNGGDDLIRVLAVPGAYTSMFRSTHWWFTDGAHGYICSG